MASNHVSIFHVLFVREKHTIRMSYDAYNLCLPPAAYLTINSFNEVKSTSPKLPSPTFISKAMIPEVLTGERREWVCTITNEAACGVGVESKKEGNEQMVSVPESLERLLSDLGVCSRVHQ